MGKPKNKLWQCSVCSKIYTNQSGLSRHKLTHRNVQFNCLDCDKIFDRKDNFNRHLVSCISKKSKPPKVWQYKHCGLKLASNQSLVRHLQSKCCLGTKVKLSTSEHPDLDVDVELRKNLFEYDIPSMRPFSSGINKVDSLSLNTDFLIKATLFDILLEVTTCTDSNDNIDFMISPGDVLNQSTPVKATVDLTTSDTTMEVNAAVNLATTIVSAETSTLVSTTKNSTTLIPDESSS